MIPASCPVLFAGNFFPARQHFGLHDTAIANTCFPVLRFISEKGKISDYKT
jgi:hypothetical protein